MYNCKYIEIEDVTPWHGDVFGHPDYKYTCTKLGREVLTCVVCNPNRCKDYTPDPNKEP